MFIHVLHFLRKQLTSIRKLGNCCFHTNSCLCKTVLCFAGCFFIRHESKHQLVMYQLSSFSHGNFHDRIAAVCLSAHHDLTLWSDPYSGTWFPIPPFHPNKLQSLVLKTTVQKVAKSLFYFKSIYSSPQGFLELLEVKAPFPSRSDLMLESNHHCVKKKNISLPENPITLLWDEYKI